MSVALGWLTKMNADSQGVATATDSGENVELVHRRRLAQILRYIANMHHSLQSAEGVGPSFVQEGRRGGRPPADFFQTDEDQSDWILFSTTDFRHLLTAEQNAAGAGQPLFPSPPFSFYAAVNTEPRDVAPRKRTFTGAFRSDSSTATSKESSSTVDGKTGCWMRITRLSNAQISRTPPESLHRPIVRDYLEGWLLQTPDADRIQDLLTLERLATPPKLPPGRDVRHKQEISSFLRQYRKYLRRKAYHDILEPMYNHLFEWVQQQSDEELVFGLGHARYHNSATNTWISSPVLEVLVEAEVSRKDGSLLLRPRDHTGVSLHRPFLAALTDTVQSTMAHLHQKVADYEPCQLCPGQPETYVPLLQEIAVQVSADGSFQSSSSQSAAASEDSSKLVITEAWCLFRRPKPSSVWARDATKFADSIMLSSSGSAVSPPSSCTNTLELPLAAWALTFGPQMVEQKRVQLMNQQESRPAKGFLEQFFSSSSTPEPVKETNPTKPLFPLPTSAPQSHIAELLLNNKYPAVVCEGPPGSGKSHTICNIVCAYLCQGKRVLVTSKNAHALAVLRERLPVTVRDLCVDISMSELSGMRQLQQTVERLANRISMVSGELEAQKCEFLRTKISEMETEIDAIDEKISEKSVSVRELLLKPDGQRFSSLSLELIEAVPWLMRTLSQWTLQEIKALRDTVRDLVLEDGDVGRHVTGFERPPSGALIAKAAARAGESIHVLTASAKSAAASLPVLGTLTGLKEKEQRTETELQGLKVRGVSPSTKADWATVVRALRYAQSFCKFETTIWKENEYKNAWPQFSTVKSNESLRDLADKLDKAIEVKTLAIQLDVDDEIEAAAQCRTQDMQRSVLVSHTQKMAEDLVDATVLVELSRSFSAEAQSALIRFAQIAGRARFGRSSSGVRMTQRQRRRRQEYLAAFDQCCRFIPCWILTASQISDYLPAEGLFDLVVVDEASQSDVTVMPGMLRGKQWLIVGDSKQVSPTESFISEEQIYGLQAALPPSPLRDSLLPGHSFFDLCSQAFPGGRVVLSEHFRCSEEIIAFSNEHFYDGQLVPLRLPTKSERLTPSLVDVKVNGVKQGKVNLIEVEKIVDLIREIVEEGKQSGNPRTIGVISLIGDEQGRMVRARLLDAIGPHGMSRHDVMIGDPPSFQGAERDIIFLTVIASPGSVPTQNQLMHFQRLNVAMSRARDRCYLVRSIDPHDIPNAEDAKLLLLTFFQSDNSDTEYSDSGNANISRSLYDKLLATLLEGRGFVCRPMGRVWRHGLCVESHGSDARAAVLVDCVGEPVHEWSQSYSQQRAIERSIVAFLEKCGIEGHKLLYVELEDDVQSSQDEAESVIEEDGERVEVPIADDTLDDAENEEGEVDIDVAPAAVGGDEDVFVISSDDGGNVSDDGVPVRDFEPLPDAIESNVPDPPTDRPDQFGRVVDLGFLRSNNPDTDIDDFAAKAHARAKEAPRERAYEADASDMGDSLLSQAAKRRRRRHQKLDKYARDPRWLPGKTGDAKDDEQANWYDTDSDLMDGEEYEGKSEPQGH